MKVQGAMQSHCESLRTDLLHTGAVDNVALGMGDVLQLGW